MTTDAPAAAPSRWQDAVIERIEHQTPRVVSVFLRAALGSQVAGQHLDVRLTGPDGYQAERSYSIASAPGSDSIELAIERLEDGEVSPYFYEVAQPGDSIEVRGPIGGHFIWRAEDGGPILLVGGGSGVAPLLSIVRYRASAAPDIPALLLYSARAWDEVISRDELLAAESQQPHFSLILVTTRGPRQRPADFDRRIDRMILHDILAGRGELPRHVYACGSNAFVESVTSNLILEGLPPERIRAERYGGP